MTSHELARILLDMPDHPIATLCHGHLYSSKADAKSHGGLEIGKLEHYAGPHVVIGDMLYMCSNKPNWHVSEQLYKERNYSMT